MLGSAAARLWLRIGVVATLATVLFATDLAPFRLHVLPKVRDGDVPDTADLFELCSVEPGSGMDNVDHNGRCGGVERVTLSPSGDDGEGSDAGGVVLFDVMCSTHDPFQVFLLGECEAVVQPPSQAVTVFFDISQDQVLSLSTGAGGGAISGCPLSYNLRDPAVLEGYCRATAQQLTDAQRNHSSLQAGYDSLASQYAALQDSCTKSSDETAAELEQRSRLVGAVWWLACR